MSNVCFLSNCSYRAHVLVLEKEMATHSSVLAWRIPGTAEPDGLPSMGSHRLRRLSSSSTCIRSKRTGRNYRKSWEDERGAVNTGWSNFFLKVNSEDCSYPNFGSHYNMYIWTASHVISGTQGVLATPNCFIIMDYYNSLLGNFLYPVSLLSLPPFILLVHTPIIAWWFSGKESACHCRRRGFSPRIGEIPWRREWLPIPGFLPGKSHGQSSLVGYSPWGRKRVGHDLLTKQQQYIAYSCLSICLYNLNILKAPIVCGS